MKKILCCSLFVIYNIIFSTTLLGQLSYTSKNVVNLKPKEVRKLTLIQLEKGEKKFPDSYLLGLKDDKLILATDISKWVEDPLFVKSEIPLKNYDYLTMLERKQKHKKRAIFATLLGVGGFWLVQKNSKATPFEVRNKTLLGQKPNNGLIESLIGGVTGVGLGIIIGTHLAKNRMKIKNQKRIVRQLQEVSFY